MGSSDSTPVHLTDVEGIATGTQTAPLSIASVGLSSDVITLKAV